MSRYIKKVSKKVGLPPGTLVHVGDKTNAGLKITRFEYDAEHCHERVLSGVEEIKADFDKPGVTWINIDGLQDVQAIAEIGAIYGIDPLALEDIVNTNQRPKMEDFGKYLFIVFKMIYPEPGKGDVASEQVSLILGNNYVLSFQEEPLHDVFALIRQRLLENKGRLRKSQTDYLVYALMDAVVDNYFIVLEKIGDKIEAMEDALLTEPKTNLPQQIHWMRRDIIYLRKQVWPLRELLFELAHSESELIQKTSVPFFRDVYDHVIQAIDTVESFRDLLAGMHDIYLSFISNRLNEVMKLLTIFSTIFIPLTFIVGVYGMNFRYMPELEMHWGYFILWGIMITITGSMIVYFKQRKWF